MTKNMAGCNPNLVDILDAEGVEVIVSDDKKLWVNVDGQCLLRIGHCTNITMDDPFRGREDFDCVIWPK